MKRIPYVLFLVAVVMSVAACGGPAAKPTAAPAATPTVALAAPPTAEPTAEPAPTETLPPEGGETGTGGLEALTAQLDALLPIRSVYMGILSLPQNLAREVLASDQGTGSAPGAQRRLTPREMDVLRCLGRGMSNQEIAEELVITQWTVRSHVHNLLEKLKLSSRTQAALYAVEIGLVVPGSKKGDG